MSRLDEIKARAEAATPGPWRWRNSGGEPMLLSRSPGLYVVMTFERMGMHGAQPVFRDPENPNVLKPAGRENIYEFSDAAFIAAVREDVPWLLAEVARLTAERDAAIERLERVIDQWRKTGRAVISEMDRADKAESERDALAKKVWNVEEVMDDIEGSDPTTWERLRDALSGSEADTTDTQTTEQGDQS